MMAEHWAQAEGTASPAQPCSPGCVSCRPELLQARAVPTQGDRRQASIPQPFLPEWRVTAGVKHVGSTPQAQAACHR